MKVIVGSKIYDMDRKQAAGIIKTAGKYVKSGIYAVEKNGVVELKKEIILGYLNIKRAAHQYKEQGFKVYYNTK